LLLDRKSIVQDLVCSLLAVNLWTVEKTFGLSKDLERESLFDMNAVSRMSHQEAVDHLINAGYARGDYITGLLADRLLTVAAALAEDGVSRLCTLIAAGEIAEMDTWLLSLKGIGPQVLKNFKMLQGL
jgi:hypothetical protein